MQADHVIEKNGSGVIAMHTVRLVKPSMEYRESYLSFYDDWISSGEDIVPWVVEKDPSDFWQCWSLYIQRIVRRS